MRDSGLEYILEPWMHALDREGIPGAVEDPVQRFGTYVYNFEKLDVWQRAMDLTTEIYRITAHFPESERFGLTAQLRRACVSVPSNLAEGVNRRTGKDKMRLLNVAYGSLMEALTQILLAHRLNLRALLSTPFNGRMLIGDQRSPGNRRATSLSLSHVATGYAPSRHLVSLGFERNRLISGVNRCALDFQRRLCLPPPTDRGHLGHDPQAVTFIFRMTQPSAIDQPPTSALL